MGDKDDAIGPDVRADASEEALVESFGAKVVGIACVVDRSGGKVRFPGRKFVGLFSLAFETFPPDNCPLCSEGIPATRPGRPKRVVL